MSFNMYLAKYLLFRNFVIFQIFIPSSEIYYNNLLKRQIFVQEERVMSF